MKAAMGVLGLGLGLLLVAGCDADSGSAGDVSNSDTTTVDVQVPDADPGPADISGPDSAPDTTPNVTPDVLTPPDGPTYATCYPHVLTHIGIDYDVLGARVGAHCLGTNHQDITDIEKVVFLGDSITAGAGTSGSNAYAEKLAVKLKERFGDQLEVADCSQGGAVNGSLMSTQIPKCFPGVEPKRTLVIITSGGNDMVQLAFQKVTYAAARPSVDKFVGQLRTALAYLKDPQRFPAGSHVIYANVYEFTDGTGQMDSCEFAALAGLKGVWLDGLQAYAYMEMEYMRAAIEFGADMLFLEEMFCGHGHNAEDQSGPCFEVHETSELWIATDCIHPNREGHAAIADGFFAVVNE